MADINDAPWISVEANPGKIVVNGWGEMKRSPVAQGKDAKKIKMLVTALVNSYPGYGIPRIMYIEGALRERGFKVKWLREKPEHDPNVIS